MFNKTKSQTSFFRKESSHFMDYNDERNLKDKETEENDISSEELLDDGLLLDCSCSCKKLVLCKGCGAYTHQECLGPAHLCSLCV